MEKARGTAVGGSASLGEIATGGHASGDSPGTFNRREHPGKPHTRRRGNHRSGLLPALSPRAAYPAPAPAGPPGARRPPAAAGRSAPPRPPATGPRPAADEAREAVTACPDFLGTPCSLAAPQGRRPSVPGGGAPAGGSGEPDLRAACPARSWTPPRPRGREGASIP